MNEMTLAEWLDKWYNLYAKPFLKTSTLVSYNGYIKNHKKEKESCFIKAARIPEIMLSPLSLLGGLFFRNKVNRMSNEKLAKLYKILENGTIGIPKEVMKMDGFDINTKIVFSVLLNDAINHNKDKVCDGEKGLFVSMPSTSYTSNGETKYRDTFHPITMLARNLLSDDGVIFISIDENEIDDLIKISLEIYGENNYIATLVRKTKTTSNNGNQFAPSHEYIIVCAKEITRLNGFNDPEAQEDEEYIKLFRFEDEYSKYNIIGLYQPALKHGGSSYPIECPDGTYVVTPEGKPWRWNEQTFLKNKAENRVVFKETKTSPLLTLDGKQAKWNIYTKLYLKDRLASGMRPITFIDKYTNSEASKELLKMEIPFDFSKPRRLIQYLIKICLADNNSIIMDFFSGSATTAHAVMQLNAEDGGHRKFVMVQLPETTAEDSEAYKAGYKNICEIGKERIRRAGAKIKAETDADIDYGFRVLKLDDTNMQDVYYTPAETTQTMLAGFESNIKPDRTDLDLLFGCLLDWGLPLSMPYSSEQIEGVTVHTYNDGDLIACFDKAIPESVINAIAKRQPLRVVFRDDSFADSPSKINVSEIFKMLSPDTRVKVI